MSKLPDQNKALDEQIQLARARGADSLRVLRIALGQAHDAVEDSLARYHSADDLKEQAECVNRAMLYICDNLLPRLRLNTTADAQAALLVAAVRKVTS